MSDEHDPRSERMVTEDNLAAVRVGHGANCSSIGSVVDTLFATATVGAAIFAAVLGALKSETIRVVGDRTDRDAEEHGAPSPPVTP